ncbi:UNVERIFIED_CONTAM: hypothetical protein GTU68_034026 [Idotea baltica]|nr:hypothetical protein [Idotea baltica]
MLEVRPTCELCAKALAPDSNEAMICTFECTFCKSCVEEILQNVCPNCGGGFERRPVRPKKLLSKYPAQSEPIQSDIDKDSYEVLLRQYREVPPRLR